MAAGKVETETLVTEGDGDDARGRRPGARPPVDRQRLHRRRRPSAPTTRTRRPSCSPSTSQLPRVPRRHHGRQRSARGSRSRLRRGGLRRGRQLPARHRQQGHRPGHRRPGLRGRRTRRRAPGRRHPAWMPAARSSRRASSAASTSTARPEPTDDLRRVAADRGHRPAASKKGRRIVGPLPRPGLRRREAVRRELRRRRHADDVRASAPARSSRAGTRGSSASRSAPAWCSPIPPELGYGEEGNPDARHPADRHARTS